MLPPRPEKVNGRDRRRPATGRGAHNRHMAAMPMLSRAFTAPLLAAAALWLAGCASNPVTPAAPPARGLAVTAHPHATEAALRTLRQGGSAVDAAIAAQLVLGLVEPQSSGLGGGALALHWDATRRELTALDGLATAPSRAPAGLAIDLDGRRLDPAKVRRGGRSVGVPGTLPLLEALHREHGRLTWRELFTPAIALAEQGFEMPPYLHRVLSAPGAAQEHAEMAGLYFDDDGRVRPVGARLTNPAYARTLREIAALGGRGWLQAGGAREIARAATRGTPAGLVSEADLLAYRPVQRAPLCRVVLQQRLCTTGPASFGGVVVLQVLQMLEIAEPEASRWSLDDPAFVHRYVEAGRMAQADRQQWIGDPAFHDNPVDALLDRDYLARRVAAIDPARAMPPPTSGLAARKVSGLVPSREEATTTTSQLVVVDARGHVLSMTTTLNLNFGSRVMAAGFALNNAMTNFAPAPPAGRQHANQMAPGKRPLTSMMPTIVFDARGEPVIAGGSAGGGQIVDYVASSLIEMMAGGRTPAQALARGHVSTAVAGTVQLERGTDAAALAAPLRERGHRLELVEMNSGLGFARRTAAGWEGAADPRRDGSAAAP